MAIRKYADGESKLTVLQGEEAQVVQNHRERVGKAVSEFSADERKALEADLAAVKKEDAPEAISPNPRKEE